MKEADVLTLSSHGSFHRKLLHGKLEETHISWVILTRKFAFKIKKPVRLSFLDFSTLQKRKKWCERELVLNRRFSDIYLSVVPIRHTGSNFIVDGHRGEIVDYAVVMRRMATTKRMDYALRRGKVSKESMTVLANTIASAHETCTVCYTPFSMTESRKLFNDLNDVAEFVKANFGRSYSLIIKKSIRWSDRILQQHRQRFQTRINDGFKRDVHGDLHSGNIFLYRTPVIFDCIEFNDSFRQIDVLYEVAFLCMDLEAFHEKDLAKKFIAAYSKAFPCFQMEEDMDIFNYFKCLRANVRAKVHAMSAAQTEHPHEFEHHLAEVKKYLLLIQGYMAG